MDSDFTSNDLLQLLYNEVPAEKAATMREAIRNDYYLNARYQELRDGIFALPKATFAPSARAIKNILNKSMLPSGVA
jgi:hypothetical protein